MNEPNQSNQPVNNILEGDRKLFDGVEKVFYCGHWILTYPVPADTLRAKKQLIQALTRRLFNHMEHGLDVPGEKLDEIRLSYEQEADPYKKRVKAGMLAGSLFNRAIDIFRSLVELQEKNVDISLDCSFMSLCGKYLMEAMELGKQVRHRSGEEGIDELWGEPFRAFSVPLEMFYETRYVKIAQAKCNIVTITKEMRKLCSTASLSSLLPILDDLQEAALDKVETLRTDENHFDVWSNMVAASERLASFNDLLCSKNVLFTDLAAYRHILRGRDLIFYIARARTSMPKSVTVFMQDAYALNKTGAAPFRPTPTPSF